MAIQVSKYFFFLKILHLLVFNLVLVMFLLLFIIISSTWDLQQKYYHGLLGIPDHVYIPEK